MALRQESLGTVGPELHLLIGLAHLFHLFAVHSASTSCIHLKCDLCDSSVSYGSRYSRRGQHETGTEERFYGEKKCPWFDRRAAEWESAEVLLLAISEILASCGEILPHDRSLADL